MRIATNVILAMSVVLWFGRASLASTVAFDNLGPNDSYGSVGYILGNSGFLNRSYAYADGFCPSSSGNLDELLAGYDQRLSFRPADAFSRRR